MHAKRSYPFASGRSDGRSGRDPYTPSRHFGPAHPLSRVARERCRAAGHGATWRGACGTCWESALRDDERFVVEFGLDRTLTVDPTYVDDVAVDRACAGDAVRLSRAEVRVAVARLAGRGLSTGQIAVRLHRDDNSVRRVLVALQAATAAPVEAAEEPAPESVEQGVAA